MIVSYNVSDFYKNTGRSVAAIGNFDGVHIGHQLLLKETVKKANEFFLPSAAITFDPHPSHIFSSNPPNLLCSLEKKLEYMDCFGISSVLVIPFTREFAELSMSEFAQNCLCGQMKIYSLIIGYDFRMGSDLAGYKEIAELLAIPVFRVNALSKDGTPVSSTRIRRLLDDGNVALAESYLGRSFSIQGKIVHGSGRGKPLLGVPTINLEYSSKMALPSAGVYSTSVRFLDGKYAGKFYPSVTSFCNNPTFSAENLTLETHLLGFSDDVYDCTVELFFMDYIRKVKQFDGIAALKEQLEADISQRSSLRKYPLMLKHR